MRADGVQNFLWHARARGSSGRTLADHLRPLPGPVLTRTRGGEGARTLADHLRPGGRPAPPPAPEPAPTPIPAASPPPTARAAAARVAEARASEQRTVLDAEQPVVVLTPRTLPRIGRLSLVLEWDRPRTAGGVWSSTDVHLGCLWQTTNGHAGVVQSTGSLLSAPGFGARQVMRLGARSEGAGEELMIDLAYLDAMARLVLFAYGKRAAPPWEDLNVRLTAHLPSEARMAMWLDRPPSPSPSAALASVHLVDGDVIFRRESEFLAGPARDVALAHGWDLDWSLDGTTLRR